MNCFKFRRSKVKRCTKQERIIVEGDKEIVENNEEECVAKEVKHVESANIRKESKVVKFSKHTVAPNTRGIDVKIFDPTYKIEVTNLPFIDKSPVVFRKESIQNESAPSKLTLTTQNKEKGCVAVDNKWCMSNRIYKVFLLLFFRKRKCQFFYFYLHKNGAKSDSFNFK